MQSSIDHSELSRALATLRLGVDASELHGSLTGFLCAGGRASTDDWLDLLALEPDSVGVARDAALQTLFDACCAQFEGVHADVEPLLPQAASSLAQRADALVDWCRGFLGGFGLAGATQRLALSTDANEVLADFAKVAAARLDYTDTTEDEEALADVVDFTRIGSAMLHREIVAGARAAARSLH
jgi:uncharacterized protein YgfB (UPF0149 family)